MLVSALYIALSCRANEVMAGHDPSTSSQSTSEGDIDSFGDHQYQPHEIPDVAANTATDLEKQDTATSGRSVFGQRAQNALSTIRSREPGQTARFTHPLSHTKTTEDVIVDFDGPDDPYRPMNWGFMKKAVTTVLYGLTTMGRFSMYFRG